MANVRFWLVVMKILRRILFSLILVVGAALTALPVLAAVLDGSPPGLQRAMEVQERNTDALMTKPGVVGTAVGLRGDGAPVVLVLTEHALVGGLPRSMEGVPVLVKVTGKIYSRHHKPGHDKGGNGEDPPPPPGGCESTTEKSRPACIGMSTGHPAITAGTIGARVTDGTNVYALSNNHVYANANAASIGNAVIQPGTFDGGSSPADDIGTLADFEPIIFSTMANNVIDAAIALSSTANLGNATLSDGYGTPKSATVAASINLKVKKYGRTTSETKGQITAINATVNVNYGPPGVARFVNQIIIEPGTFSAGGDSGSLIVVDGKGRNKRDNRKSVGLLFAGSFFVTIANPIDDILGRFGVTVDGE